MSIRYSTTSLAYAGAIAIAFLPGGVLASTLVYAAMALTSGRHAILALLGIWLVTTLNPGIAASSGGGPLRYLIIALCAVTAFRLAMRNNSFVMPKAGASALLFIPITTLHAILVSPIPDVSFFKGIMWALSMGSTVVLWHAQTESEKKSTFKYVIGVLMFIMAAALIMSPLPVARFRNGVGLQGVLNHPQALGVCMAILVCILLMRLIAIPRPKLMDFVPLAASLAALFLSQARTGAIGGFGAVLITITLYALAGRRSAFAGLKSAKVMLAVAATLVLAMINMGSIASTIENFVLKGGRDGTTNIAELYQVSRGTLLEPMLENIADHPLTGIGFGIASKPENTAVVRDAVTGLPLSAPIEKGITPLAIIEENGAVIGALIYLWLFYIGRLSWRDPTNFAIFVAIMLLNANEANFFSPNGMGLLQMLLIGYAASKPCPEQVTASISRRGSYPVSRPDIATPPALLTSSGSHHTTARRGGRTAI